MSFPSPALQPCVFLLFLFSVSLCRYKETQIHIVSSSIEYILFCTRLFISCIFEIFPLLHGESFLILSPLCSALWMGLSLFNQARSWTFGLFPSFYCCKQPTAHSLIQACFALCVPVE